MLNTVITIHIKLQRSWKQNWRKCWSNAEKRQKPWLDGQTQSRTWKMDTEQETLRMGSQQNDDYNFSGKNAVTTKCKIIFNTVHWPVKDIRNAADVEQYTHSRNLDESELLSNLPITVSKGPIIRCVSTLVWGVLKGIFPTSLISSENGQG